jgi:hypothetical protein
MLRRLIAFCLVGLLWSSLSPEHTFGQGGQQQPPDLEIEFSAVGKVDDVVVLEGDASESTEYEGAAKVSYGCSVIITNNTNSPKTIKIEWALKKGSISGSTAYDTIEVGANQSVEVEAHEFEKNNATGDWVGTTSVSEIIGLNEFSWGVHTYWFQDLNEPPGQGI